MATEIKGKKISPEEKQRLTDIRRIKKLQGKSWDDLAKTLPISGEGLGLAFRRGSVQPEYLEEIERVLGNQLEEDLNEQNEQKILNPQISDKGVPYYDVDFHGGFTTVFDDQTARPSYYIDFPPYNHCDAWINVTGKSMSPFISHGDIAALKKLEDWRTFFPLGEVYAIYTREHRTIKIVTAGKDEDHLTLIPYNKSEEFVKQQIPKSIIKQMFRVHGSIKKFF